MSEKPEEPRGTESEPPTRTDSESAADSASREAEAQKRNVGDVLPILSSRPPVAAPPRPRSSGPPPGSDPTARSRSSRPPPNPRRSSFPPPSQPPTSIIDTERQTPIPGIPAEAAAQVPKTPQVPRVDMGVSIPPARSSIPSPMSSPLGYNPEPSPFETAIVAATEPHASEPHASEPPAAGSHASEPPAAGSHALEPHAAGPHGSEPPAAGGQDAAELRAVELRATEPQAAVPRAAEPHGSVLHGSEPPAAGSHGSVPPATGPTSSPPGAPAEREEHVHANPIRAMRVIRIEETKKRSPSAPVLETVESTYDEVERELTTEQRDALAAVPVPEDIEPISETEPLVDFESPDPADSIEVDFEHVESVEPAEVTEHDGTGPSNETAARGEPPPRPPPPPSTGPSAPGREPQPELPPADRKPPPPRRSGRPVLPKVSNPRKKAWWETIFGDDFSRAYRPMSQSQLAREVDFILEGLSLPRGAVILDLGCGQGEICVELARRGYSVVGYDLSVYQLAMAGDNAQQAKQKINFLQGDMREMAFDEMFDAVICWDTSFGYFEDEKNIEVLQRIKKALKPGGRLLLDVMNRDFAAREAPYNHWFEGDGCVCMDDMNLDWITNRLAVKRSIILDDGRSKELQYSTRLYTLSELGRVLHEVGFRVSAVSGDIHTKGAFFGPHSRRIIIQAGKP